MTSMTSVTEVVRVVGADALSYLDSQCTQDLLALAATRVAETLVLSPKGEIVSVASVTYVDDVTIDLDVPIGTAADTIARLTRFAIRADVAFDGPRSHREGDPVWLSSELARITAGIPGTSELARALVPHALDAALLECWVSSTKGCYPGQELVARMQSRGATPPYVLRRCTLDAKGAPGDAVGDLAKDGAITSVALDEADGTYHALCVLHRTDAAERTAQVRSSAGATVASFS